MFSHLFSGKLKCNFCIFSTANNLIMVKLISLLTPLYVTLFWGLIFLFKKKSSDKTNQVLAAFMFAACALYVSHTFYFLNLYQLYSFVESIYLLALMSIYPLFYRYILSLSSENVKPLHYFYHFLPGIILATTSLVIAFFLGHDGRTEYVKEVLIQKNLKQLNFNAIAGVKGGILLLTRIIFICQSIIYALLGIRLANRHNREVIEYYSNTEGRKMNWVRHLSVLYLLISFVGILMAIIGRSIFAQKEILLIIPSVIFSTIYFIIGFNGNRQLAVSHDFSQMQDINVEFDEIDFETGKNLKNKLVKLFEKDKIYRHSDLRITFISEALKTNRTYISRLINEEFGMNFNEFVNQYRVREAEALLSSTDHNSYKLEYIAEKVGFGSGDSFTRAFKEHKGITPGQFRSQINRQTQLNES